MQKEIIICDACGNTEEKYWIQNDKKYQWMKLKWSEEKKLEQRDFCCFECLKETIKGMGDK